MKKLRPVLRLYSPQGHTSGSQSAAIAIEPGRVVIPGLCSIDENYSTDEVSIPDMHFDPFQAYESVVRIKRMADIVLPTHSQSLVHTKSILPLFELFNFREQFRAF